MKTSSFASGLGLAAAMAVGASWAQSLTPVMTDVNPLPAEERSSVGAIVLENSMVRAQREMLSVRSGPDRVQAVGRDAIRATRTAHARDEIKQSREDAEIRLHEMGAGSIDPR